MKRTTCIAKTFAVIVLLGALTAGCTHDEVREETTPKTAAPSTSTEATATIAKEDTLLSAMPTTLDLHPDVRVKVSKGKAFVMQLDGMMLAAVDSAVLHDGTYTATALNEGELPKLPSDHVNVTAGSGAGYRLLPGGEHFSPYAELRVAYDEGKLPRGYTPDDIHTSYYDTETGVWTRLVRKEVDTLNKEIVSLTTHFTDFVNEVLKAPEMPETQAFVPTMMSELEAANPLEGLTLIQPPTANNNGTANLSYPLQIPAGRQGMQPNLVLTYNSGGGNGWLGIGWDLSVPCITVETRWGVPRYDVHKESEVYLLNGEQLVTKDKYGNYLKMPHRTNIWNERLPEGIQFFPRVDDIHDSIVRHGDGPMNYWWSVTHSNGVTDYYGRKLDSETNPYDESANEKTGTLRDRQGNIAKWMLTESQDLYGNTVHYYYDYIQDIGIEGGSIKGGELYLSAIHYTGNGTDEGPYSIEFKRKLQKRQDAIITGNYGFKEVSADLLEGIVVKYDNKVSNIYYFETESPSYQSMYKTRLKSVTKIDTMLRIPNMEWETFIQNAGEISSCTEHKRTPFLQMKIPYAGTTTLFEYYDVPSEENLFGESVDMDFGETPSGINDNIFTRNLSLDYIRPSALGATKGRSWDIGGTVGVGIGPVVALSTASISGNYSYSESESTGMMTLIDLDGDGLADKVYKRDNKLYYRPQKTQNNEYHNIKYGDEIRIENVEDFLVENSSTNTWGAQMSCIIENFSGGWPKTTSMTSVYFADVNADGLPDLVNNGSVMFNTLDDQGNVTFSYIKPTPILDGNGDYAMATVVTKTSTDRCDPVIIDGEVDPNIVCTISDIRSASSYTVDEYLEQKDQLIEQHPDGWWEYAPEEDTPYHFIVPSWACEPQYIDPNFESVKVWIAPRSGNVTIYDTIQMKENHSVQQSRFADGIDYCIQLNSNAEFDRSGYRNAGSPIELYRNHIDNDDLTRKTHADNMHVNAGDIFLFRLISGSDHAFDDVDWWHTIVYTDGTNTNDCYGRPANRFDSKGDFVVSGDMYFQATADGVIDIDVDMKNLNNSGSVNVVVKHYSQSVCSSLSLNSSYQLNSHQVHEGDSIIIELVPSGTVHWGNIICKPHIAYTFTPQDELDHNLAQTTIDYYPPARMNISYPNSNTNMYSRYQNDTLQRLFGPLYRGWGQFAYNNIFSDQLLSLNDLHLSDIYSHAISGTEDDLVDDADAISENAEEIDVPTDENDAIPSQSTMNNALSASGAPDVEGSNTQWIEMVPDSKNQAWYGYGQTTYITRTSVSNTRQPQYIATDEVNDIITYDSPIPMPTSSNLVQGIRKVCTSKSESSSLGLSLAVVTVGKSFSTGSNVVETDYMDLNGDRYPDFIGTDQVQYSQPWGGIGNLSSFPSWINGETYSLVSTNGTTFGASCPSPQRSASGSPRNSKISLKGDGSIGASINKSEDRSTFVWMDMNGDGLPDRVKYNADNHSCSVALNIGYTFLPYEKWVGLSTIRSGESHSSSINLGGDLSSAINIAQGSISAGFALSRSHNTTKTALCDLNGDGLPDIWMAPADADDENAGGKVYYNLGNGHFSNFFEIPALKENSVSNSFNESVNVGATVGVTIGGIVKITVGANGTPQSGSITRDSLQVVDVNGDGYPDIVTSNNEETMSVRFSQIGKANLLKKVTNFTSSYFMLDYEMPAACYEQSQRQWVLSELTTHNSHTPVGVDSVKTKFSYSKPHYDRYERSSFGYETVVTDQYSGCNVYRSTHEDYENLLYAKRGKKKHDIVYDGTDNPYVEHFYNTMIQDGETTMGDTNCPTHVTTRREVELTNFYEGHSTIQMSTAKSYEYDAYHNVVRYTNLGDINHTGDELHADITYLSGLTSNLVSLKSDVCVYGSDINHPYRRSEFQYDNGANDRGKLTKRMDYNGTQTREFYFEYDAIYGNMTKARLPQNNHNQRIEYQYAYDNFVQSYPVVVSNPAFGMQSTMEYDYRFGKPTKVIDVAGQQITYCYDYAGRMLEAKGPMSIGNTLRYNYYPRNYIHSDESNPWAGFRMFNTYSYFVSGSTLTMPEFSFAITTHFSDDGNDSIRTSLLVDASGLIIQTKSESEFYGNHLWIVSGKVQYDEWGRSLLQYDPVPVDFYDIDENDTNLNNEMWGQYCNTASTLRTETFYDILDRTTQTKVHHNSSCLTESTQYDIVNRLGRNLFLTQATDANGGISSSFTDGLGRNIQNVDAMNGVTTFEYDELGQLLSSTDPDGFPTMYEYDMFGQVTKRTHPDAGISTFAYDPAGNVIGQTFSNGDQIDFQYDYNRLVEKHYSRNAQNDVFYGYDAAGRVSYIRDASGEQELFYDPMGNVSENSRTFAIPGDTKTYTFTMRFSYDSWGRVLRMVYPDGEKVNYRYDRGWNLKEVTTQKNGETTILIRNIKYNMYNKRVLVTYGNSTETQYTYDDLQRLKRLSSTCLVGGSTVTMQDIYYDFDNVSNITSVDNRASRISSLNMGGAYANSYFYDANNRLIGTQNDADGYFDFDILDMVYSDAGRIDSKRQPGTSQDLYFGYCTEQPHAPLRIFNDVSHITTDLSWDANGNLIQAADINTEDPTDFSNLRSMYWSPENRMHTSINDEYYGYYVYDNAGERTLKLSGASNIIDMNADVRISMAELDKITLYTSPYLVATEKGYTKHYYAGTERLAARIGNGGIIGITGRTEPCPTGGAITLSNTEPQKDLILNSDNLFKECMQEVSNRKWISPSENVCAHGILNDLEELRIKVDIPPFLMDVQPKIDTKPFQDAMLAAEDNNGMPEDELYFYHSDHLGGANWITDLQGLPVQHLIYRPFGEPFVDEHTVYDERFKFTGKELDEETGYGYFGARYYDATLLAGWTAVDPMADKYPNVSPYAYCAWNPMKLVDPDGRDVYLLTNDGHIKRSQELTDKYQNKYGGNDVLYSQETGKFSRTFTVGTLSDMESHTTKGYSGSFLKLRDTERKDCVDVFIFCAENSNVEYSLMEFAQGESKETVLTTSHQIRTYSGSYGDDMGSAYAKDNICNLLSHIHNHFFTVGASYSEDGESPDMNFMNWVNSSRICANDESQGNSVSFGIYKCRGDKYMTDYYGNTIDPITMQKIKK